MMSSQFDPSSTSVWSQKPWTSSFYGSMNDLGFKTLYNNRILVKLVLGIQVAMCMTRILVKLVLGIHVFLGFMWGGRLAYKSKD